MQNRKKHRKVKLISNKVLLTRVTKEMVQPRMTQSAQTKTENFDLRLPL